MLKRLDQYKGRGKEGRTARRQLHQPTFIFGWSFGKAIFKPHVEMPYNHYISLELWHFKLELDRWALYPQVTGHASLVAAGSWIQMMRNAVFIPRQEVQKYVSDINQINGVKWYSEDWLKNVLSCILCSTSKLSLKSQNLREMSTWTPLLWLCYKSAFTEQGLTLGHWIVSWVLKFVMVSCSE